MANLNGQDIGLNYKGIITIGSTINQNISASLQDLTDGDGNNLPLQLATDLVAVNGGTIAYTTGTNTRSVLSQTYTINNTGGTNTINGILVNAIETAIVGTTHRLIDLQVGGVSKFNVDRNGTTAVQSITSNTWLMQFTDSSSGFLLYRGSNRFKVSALGIMAAIGGAAVGYDTATVSARLQVRGDGTNPIARFENLAGTSALLVNNDLSLTTGGSLTVASDITGGFSSYTLGFLTNVVRMLISSSSAYAGFQIANNGNITRTTGETSTAYISGLFAAGIGSANYKPLRIEYTINNGGAQSGTATGIFLNATQTNLNSMVHNLMDLQVGTVSKFKITNTGAIGDASSNIGFYGASPIAKPTVSGVRNDPEQALASLLTELANLGLITNSTTPA